MIRSLDHPVFFFEARLFEGVASGDSLLGRFPTTLMIVSIMPVAKKKNLGQAIPGSSSCRARGGGSMGSDAGSWSEKPRIMRFVAVCGAGASIQCRDQRSRARFWTAL